MGPEVSPEVISHKYSHWTNSEAVNTSHQQEDRKRGYCLNREVTTNCTYRGYVISVVRHTTAINVNHANLLSYIVCF